MLGPRGWTGTWWSVLRGRDDRSASTTPPSTREPPCENGDDNMESGESEAPPRCIALICEAAEPHDAAFRIGLHVLTTRVLERVGLVDLNVPFQGLIIDLTSGSREVIDVLRHRMAAGSFADLPMVALVASDEGAARAVRLGSAAIVSCTESRAEGLERALAVCRALVGATATAPDYAGLLEAHGKLEEMHRRLRARAEDDDVQRAMIVHDLRSPLAVVRGVLDELRDASDLDLLALADAGTRQLEELIERLEQLPARTEGPSRPERIDLAALATGVAEGLRHARESRGKSIVVHHRGAAHLVADRQDLVRVLSNLANNALRHARSRVEIAVDADETELRLVVRDDGPGIPAAVRSQLFRRFVRNPGAGRMGLGLAIVQRAVERHGGRVELRDASAEQEGACFVVHLPRQLALL